MIDWSFLLAIVPELLLGLTVTLKATAGGFTLALLVGLLVALGNRSKLRAVRELCRFYVAVLRCTPLLVQLYLAFYVLPSFGIRFGALTTGILVLGLHTGAYISEVYRAGIDAVPRGQWEAAVALGLHAVPLWLRVVLPQAIPPMVPPLGNFLIGMFKETPLLAAITVLDLFGTANDIAGRTYRYTEPYTAAALILLGASLAAAAGLRWTERRLTAATGGGTHGAS